MDTKEVLQRIREKRIDAEFTNQLLVELEADIGKCEKQIELMEDAVMIYHMQRAPTRRAWYVSVGNCRGDRAKWIVQDFKKDMAEALDSEGISNREDIFFPRFSDEHNNSCAETLDTPTTWDGGALLETLYAKRDRLLTQYSKLYDSIGKGDTSSLVEIICESSALRNWRLR